MPKHCSVACETSAGVMLCQLELPDAATIADALAMARRLLGETLADWDGGATGIYGQQCPRQHVPADGARIELYRPLASDPRAARRARVAVTRPLRRGPRVRKSTRI